MVVCLQYEPKLAYTQVCKSGRLKEVNWLRVGSGDAIGMANVSS